MSKNIDKIPTGKRKTAVEVVTSNLDQKIKTLDERKARRERREKEHENFRIKSLRRRCKRMGFSEELTNKAVEELKAQLKEPASYNILIIFQSKDRDFVIQALKNAKIDMAISGPTRKDFPPYGWVDGDEKILSKLREILPEKTKIHPYKKKAKNVLTDLKSKMEIKKSPTNNTVEVRKAAKSRRKAKNVAKFKARPKTGGHRCKKHLKTIKAFRNPGFKKRKISLSELRKVRKAKEVQMKKNNATETKKTVKNAA